jgi:hypothetical protein
MHTYVYTFVIQSRIAHVPVNIHAHVYAQITSSSHNIGQLMAATPTWATWRYFLIAGT